MRPPLASEALLGLIRAARDEMKLLVEANDVNKAADMAITVLSVVDANENLQQDETVRIESTSDDLYFFSALLSRPSSMYNFALNNAILLYFKHFWPRVKSLLVQFSCSFLYNLVQAVTHFTIVIKS